MSTPTRTPPSSGTAPVSRERVIEINQAAWEYWRWHASQPRAWTVDYLTHRGLAHVTAGLAPHGWTRLTTTLGRHGVSSDELLAAGLSRHATTGHLIDTFRDRLVLPIRDQTHAIIGFTARRNPTLDTDPDTRAPKYLNTTTTAAFDKSRVLYGLDHDANARLASHQGTLVIVEGALDAEAVRSLAGPWVPVAACGTAITRQHLQALAAVDPGALRDAVIALDPDTAGQAAARRLWDLLPLDDAANIRNVRLPGDPAQMIQDRHRDALSDALTTAPRFVEHLVNDHLDTLAPTFQEQHQALTRLANTVSRLDTYTLGEVADRLASGYNAAPTATLTTPDVVAAILDAKGRQRGTGSRETPAAHQAADRSTGPPSRRASVPFRTPSSAVTKGLPGGCSR